jgi:hypothetical protein
MDDEIDGRLKEGRPILRFLGCVTLLESRLFKMDPED